MGKVTSQMSKHSQLDTNCNVCNSNQLKLLVNLTEKPKDEKVYGKPFAPASYKRSIYQCKHCGAYCNIWDEALNIHYQEDWIGTLYKDGILGAYNKIRSFPLEKSDNKNRAQRVHKFLSENNFNPKETTILDIGCGTCVFLGEMKDLGYNGFAVDPDPASIEHAKKNVHVQGFAGTLEEFTNAREFEVITFNKVLEHIKDPVTALKTAASHLVHNGMLYVEVPDSAAAEESLIDREEFWLGHYNIYNKQSLNYVLNHAGFSVLEIKSIRDPSGKYTIYAFAKKSSTT